MLSNKNIILANNIFLILLDKLKTIQDDFYSKNGEYKQYSLLKLGALVSTTVSADIFVDIYTSPLGHGYIVTMRKTDANGVEYYRTKNFGPDSREDVSEWSPVKDPLSNLP